MVWLSKEPAGNTTNSGEVNPKSTPFTAVPPDNSTSTEVAFEFGLAIDIATCIEPSFSSTARAVVANERTGTSTSSGLYVPTGIGKSASALVGAPARAL